MRLIVKRLADTNYIALFLRKGTSISVLIDNLGMSHEKAYYTY